MVSRDLVVRNGNLWPGLVLAGIGLGAFSLGMGYGLGSWMMVGAGAFPALVSAVLICCGILIAAEDFLGRRVSVAFPLAAGRAGAGLFGAILVFALTIERLGLVPATALCALIVSLTSSQTSRRQVLGLVVVLPVASWAVFILALGLQAPAFVWEP